MTIINSEAAAQAELDRMETYLIDGLWLKLKKYEDEEDEGNTTSLSERIVDKNIDWALLIEVALYQINENDAIQIVREKGWWDYSPSGRIVEYMVGNACYYSTGLLCYAVVIDHLLMKVLGKPAYENLFC